MREAGNSMAFTDEELQKIRKHLNTAEANAQSKKGLFTQRLRVSKILLLVLLSDLMALPAFMLWHYGTFSPCGALTQALHGAVRREAASKATTPADMRDREASAQWLFPVVDLRIEAMSPGECTKALVRLETLGENPFADLFSVQPTPQPKWIHHRRIWRARLLRNNPVLSMGTAILELC